MANISKLSGDIRGYPLGTVSCGKRQILAAAGEKEDSDMGTILEEMKSANAEMFRLLKILGSLDNEVKARETFSLMCKYEDGDELALFCLKWIISVKEEYLIQQAVQKTEEVDEIKVKRFRAAGALSIFSEIPMSAYSIMPKTKEFAFSEIVRECYETTDEKWSDDLFKFLCSIEFNCSEDEKQLEKIVRERTDSKVFKISPLRLYRHILIAASERKGWERNRLDHPRTHIERIGEVVFNAWRINFIKGFKDMERVVKILQPLEGISDEAFECSAVFSNKIADFNEAVNELRDILKPLTVVTGSTLSRGELSIRSKYDFRMVRAVFTCRRHLNRECLSEIFSRAGEIVAGWKAKQAHHDYLVYLVMDLDGEDRHYYEKQF